MTMTNLRIKTAGKILMLALTIVMLSFGNVVMAQAPEPTLTDPNLNENIGTIYYLYNIKAKAFLRGANDYNTRASIDPEHGYQFRVHYNGDSGENAHTYILNDYVETKNDWYDMFTEAANNYENTFVDRGSQDARYWIITSKGDQKYTFTNKAKPDSNLRWRGDWSDTRLYLESGDGDEWGFVTPANYKAYLGELHKPAPKLKDLVFYDEASTGNGSWTIDVHSDNPGGYNFQVKRTNNDYEGDGSNMQLPMVEYWRGGGNNLIDADITRQITELQPGKYTVSLKVLVHKTSIQGVSFLVNSTEYPYVEDGNNGNSSWKEFSVPVTVGSDGTINLDIKIKDANFSWVLFKDLQVTFTGYTSFEHYKGIVSEMGTPPEGLKVNYKTSEDDSRLGAGVILQRAHEYTHDIYVLPGQTYTLEPFSDFASKETDVNGYIQRYVRWYDYKTDQKSSRLSNFYARDGEPVVEIGNKGHFGSLLITGKYTTGAYTTYTAPNSHDDIFDIIAIDVSNDATPLKTNTSNNYALIEPTLQYRHIFVIHNAEKLADEMSETKAKNEAYIKSHKIKLLCPEGTPFQYRLDNFEYRGFGNQSKPTGLYYKSGDTYKDVYHYRVETLIKNGDDYEVLGSTIYNKSISNNKNVVPYKKEYGIDSNPVLAAPNASGEYVVHSPAKVSQAWDSQFWIGSNATLATGDYNIHFEYKASAVVTAGTQGHREPGDYLNNDGIGNINFKTDWQTFDGTLLVSNNQYKSLVFNLTQTDAVDFYFKNITASWPVGNTSDATGKKLETNNRSDEVDVCDNMKSVIYNGKEYSLAYTYKCIEGYDRTIYIKKPVVGEYIIRVYAIDSDDGSSYTDIKTADGQANLLLMEYDLEVLPSSKASLLTKSELDQNQYAHQRPSSLENTYGEPTAEVNFDNLKASECTLDSSGDGYYKWPWLWETSSYGFGYSEPYDYNMYRIANRSSMTKYKRNDNIYDRLYADTDKNEKGFFFYANAASDPTRMAVLDIGKNLCTNTRVYVSAWINEFNNNWETANVVFSFIGVDKDGKETILSSYVSGYVTGGQNTPIGFKVNNARAGERDEGYVYYDSDSIVNRNPDHRGSWMHVYYSFVPEVSNSSNFDHFIISLENNCTSSDGADYAIDDIRCFVCHPTVFAHQTQPVCNGSKTTELKFTADFDHLLQAFNLHEGTVSDNTDKSFHFCFIDKEKFEAELEARKKDDGTYQDDAYQKAFNAALVKGTYGIEEGTSPNYGTFTFNTYFDSSNERYQQYSALRTVSFSGIHITDADMKVNGQYIIAMVDATAFPTPDYLAFDIMNKCAYTSEFKIIASTVIKVDGRISSDLDGASICANQRPNISLDLNGISRSDGTLYNKQDAEFDWFFGSINDYNAAKYEGQSLSQAIVEFRAKYPSVSQDDFASKDPAGDYTLAMKNCISYFVNTTKTLKLFQKNTVVSIMDHFHGLGEGESQDYYITVIPINPTPTADIEYCLDAFQIHITLSTRNPQMKDGDDQNRIDYPKIMRDVPLRIGLSQLDKCRIDDIDGTYGTTLIVPLRDVTPVTTNASKLVKDTNNDYIYLAASDDPALDPDNEDYDANSGAIDIIDDDGNKLSGLKCIGRLKEIKAIYTGRIAGTNYCRLAFLENFKFREGYSYTIKFNFLEAYDDNNGDVIIKGDICPGDVIMTIKVVPEYQMWTGAVSRNWNDDRNWRRVTRAELFNPTTTAVGNAFVTDGKVNPSDAKPVNSNKKSFVPADFTKVIIPANPEGGRIPYLYNLRQSTNLTGVVYAGIPSASSYIKDMGSSNTAIDDVPTTTYGTGTDAEDADISHEMSSYDLASGDVACQSWYDHTCDQIHFMSGAELMDQRYLHYNKAWADIEMIAGEWNSVALPIANVVAGDFYLPTDGARQDTPLFQDITFDPTIHDRFRPAVYQRTWNAGQAKIVHLKEDNTSAAMNMEWSHVYNDVNVRYNSGKGFSVKPDISLLPDTNKPTDDIVKFRFPKADTGYTYYNPASQDGGNSKKTDPINGDDTDSRGNRLGKLATLNASGEYNSLVGDSTGTAKDMRYFLIGNPFVCHINMKEFFEQNTNLAEKYWIETAEGQRTAIMDDNGWISTIDDATSIAPGQSFFVKLKDDQDASKNIYPKFTSDMMKLTDAKWNNTQEGGTQGDNKQEGGSQGDNTREGESQGNNTQGGGTQGEGNQGNNTNNPTSASKARMYITASYGNSKSIAVLTDAQTYHHSGAELLLDADLYDDIYVYASVKGQAMSIGQIEQGDTIPIGIAGRADNAIISIKGANTFGYNLYLIDSELGTTTLIDDDVELESNYEGVRYYIYSKSIAGSEKLEYADLPRLTVSSGTITGYAPQSEPIKQLSIYSTNGMLMETFSIDAAQQKTSSILPTGTYLVKVVTPSYEHTYKLLVK